MKNVVGLFDNMQDAEAVVRDLRAAGVADADISFAGRNADEATMASNQYVGEGHSEAAEGAGFGATGGTVVGGLTGLLVGLGALTIPGVGPVIAAGTLATALGSAALGAGIGAAAGGLLGALVGAGIPEEDAHVYSEGIRRGGALVMAKVDDTMVDTALDIMERHNVVDIDERGTSYREGGWTRFDDSTSTTGYSTADSGYRGDADSALDRSDYDRSSKVGTAGGAVAGAATGAAIGSAGGPVGTVIGGVAGAVTGGAVGAAGDAAGAEAADADSMRSTDYDTTRTTDYSANAVGSSSMDYSTTGTGYSTTGDANSTLDRGDYDRSSKVGTAGGAVAGAATGAAIGSAGGPVGTVVGGVAGAVTGGGVGAAGDAAGAEASDNDPQRMSGYDTTGTTGTSYGSVTDTSASTLGSGVRRSRTYDAPDMDRTVGEGRAENMASRIENATERGLDADLDRDGDVGQRDPRNNY